MNWIKSRISEPTTWLAVGVGAIIISAVIPAWAGWLMIAAAVTVAAGILLKEKGS
tara:strand:+ start:659 stop:823 length:165 start_codon:yes stop_codon:yes gene_type:complete